VRVADPSYIIRSAPANASDSHLCTTLAFNCVHGAMGGRTGFTVGFVDGAAVWIPISAIATLPPRLVDPEGRMYARMCNFTGQPFLG
jgi:6-phosphofructokinase 1